MAGTAFPYPPEWKFFRAYPQLDGQHPPFDMPDTDTRIVGCWEDVPGLSPPCQLVLMNQASRAPWDVLVQTGLPSFTSLGNNANTAEAWISPLTPSPAVPFGEEDTHRSPTGRPCEHWGAGGVGFTTWLSVHIVVEVPPAGFGDI